jgi:predicted RNA-binding Zn ribbon-like protein
MRVGFGLGGDGPEPAGRPPAPEPVRLAQEFMNTVDLEDGPDLFETEEGLRRWLSERRLIAPGDPVSAAELDLAVRTREALRSLVIAKEAKPAADPVRMLRSLGIGVVRVSFDPNGTASLEPTEGGVAGGLSSILATVYRSTLDGTWGRLKACRRDVCHWVFYDRSKNRSGTWCAMEICGNRTKTSAYYRRTHTRRPSEAGA